MAGWPCKHADMKPSLSTYLQESGIPDIEAAQLWENGMKDGPMGRVVRAVLQTKRDIAVEELVNAADYETFREKQGVVKGIDKVIATTKSPQKFNV